MSTADGPASKDKRYDQLALGMAVLAIGFGAIVMTLSLTRVDHLERELMTVRTKAEQDLGTLAQVRQEAAQLRDELGQVPGLPIAPPPLFKVTIRGQIHQLQQRLGKQEKKIKDLETQLAKLKDKGNP